MKSGIAPDLLLRQVENTAAWLWKDPRSEATIAALDPARAAVDHAAAGPAYAEFLLAAHFATVATFVPTDVDARIRHHMWMAQESAASVAELLDVVDRVAAWDVRPVTARYIEDEDGLPLSGHDGEWFSVRAGALGRAATLGASDLVERIRERIDAELDREERTFEAARASGDARRTLTAATIIAHNLGDLSRVVAEWPKGGPADLRERWTRLGHGDSPARRKAFVVAGSINKAIMAAENHRFLALRQPRALRASRELLLPIGPWFDGWGETIARSPVLEDRDRAEVLAALLELHGRDPNAEGCLRAIAGLHRATRGGIELYVHELPARMRKDALRGKVRDALDVTPEHFAARIERRFKTALASV